MGGEVAKSEPLTSVVGGGSGGKVFPSSRRYRRSSTTGAAQDKRQAWGTVWGAINKELGRQLRERG